MLTSIEKTFEKERKDLLRVVASNLWHGKTDHCYLD